MAEVGKKIEGLGECLANMKDYGHKLANATPTSLKQGGLYLQRESQLVVPVGITGNLKNSAFTRMNGRDEVDVGYEASYSVYVHEILTNKHPIGKAKFLTDPMEEKEDEIVRIIANNLRKVKPRTV